MEKIETNNEEIKNETNALPEPVAEISSPGIVPPKVKIKRKRISKKIAKPVEIKMEEPVSIESLFIEPKVAEAKVAKLENVPKKGLDWLKVVIIAFILGCILGLSGTAFYFYRQYKKMFLTQNIASSSGEQAKKEAQSIAETIGQFMELPGNEEPVLATVTDIEKIKNQPFFANARNGDKVLIYSQAGNAILYRPSTNKVIGVTSLTGGGENVSPSVRESTEQEPQEQAAAQEQTNVSETKPASDLKVAVYNGTNTKGLAGKIAEKISSVEGIEISEKTNAAGNYEKNLVIDLSGNHGELAQKIAETLGGEVGILPEGEIKPEADILVIAAKEWIMN